MTRDTPDLFQPFILKGRRKRKKEDFPRYLDTARYNVLGRYAGCGIRRFSVVFSGGFIRYILLAFVGTQPTKRKNEDWTQVGNLLPDTLPRSQSGNQMQEPQAYAKTSLVEAEVSYGPRPTLLV